MGASNKAVFVDASALVALYYRADSHTKKADSISAQLAKQDTPLITTNHVVAEALTIVSQRAGKKHAVVLGNDVWHGGIMSVVHLDKATELGAFDLFATMRQKNVSFVDCSCFVLCEQLGIKQVFGFDKHFAKQGFKLLKP